MNFPKVITEENQIRYEFMGGSSIMVTPGEFEERTCKEEFLSDADFMSPLFITVHRELEEYFKRRVKKPMPDEIYEYIEILLFNEAYKLCCRIFEEGRDVYIPEINTIPYISEDDLRELIFSIAYCIKSLTEHFYDRRLGEQIHLGHHFRNEVWRVNSFYFVKNYGIALDPICFGKIRCKAKESVENRKVDTVSHDTEDVERLKKQILELERLLESERKEKTNLAVQLKNQEPKIVYKDKVVEVEKVVEVDKVVEKEVPMPDGVSLDVISEYALGLAKDNEVQVLIDFMNRLLLEESCSVDVLRPLIKKLNEHKRKLQKPVAQQVNHFNTGATFNDIHNNDNSNIHTNGRG